MIAFYGIELNNGQTLEGKKIGELVEEIIYKFSEAGLSCTEAKIVLEKTADVLGEFSIVQKVTEKDRREWGNTKKQAEKRLRKGNCI